MPGRGNTFVENGIYHIFNRTIDGKKIFVDYQLCSYFLDLLQYYRSTLSTRSYSHYKELSHELQKKHEIVLNFEEYFRADIICYCLMPTHFHLLLVQRLDGGVQTFVGNVINSFTRYFNIKQKRKGPLFLPRFQSREVLSDDILLHISRYQHLNPYSSGLVQSVADLEQYQWSSYKCYVGNISSNLVQTTRILNQFNSSKEAYKAFVEDQADYQRSLDELKYLVRW